MTTPEQNAQQIAANTQAIAGIHEAMNFLLNEFIRPNLQQHQHSLERLDRHAEGMIALEQRIDQIAASLESVRDIIAQTSQQQQVNAQQIAQTAEALTRYDARLEETRQLMAKNASDIAQASARHNREMAAMRAMQAQTDERIEANRLQIADNAQQVTALAEASRTQLAGIISNANRLSKLEHQAS